MIGRTTIIAHNGKSLTVNDWSVESGINPQTLTCRLNLGWPMDRAITEPPSAALRKGDDKITKNDYELKLDEAAVDSLPKELKRLTKEFKGTKLGKFLRNYHREAFDTAFKKYYAS